MKSILYIAISCLLVCCTTVKKQKPVKDVSFDTSGLPSLTFKQMQDDHDSLVSYISQVSPIIYFNKEVRGIDFFRHAKGLRAKIKKQTTLPEYIEIVEKTLNAAQDGHSDLLGKWHLDILKSDWIPTGFVQGIDSLDIEYGYKYAGYRRKMYTKLNLDLIYTAGDYFNLLPFSYNGKIYPASMKLLSCENTEIHKFVKGETELISPLRWDKINNRIYSETFYTPASIYKNDTLRLVFSDTKNRRYKLTIAKNDTVVFLEKKKHEYGYNTEKTPIVTHYFKDNGIFYAKLPIMIEQYADSLNKEFEHIIKNNKVKAVVLDIRGNPGGSDNTYGNFLKKIIKDTLRQNIVVGRNFSPFTKNYFNINRDSIKNRTSHTFNVDVATLKNPEMYYITQDYDFVTPEATTYPFDGKIYILQDRFIYSSASNLSSLAKKHDRLVSIGETPDLLGGLQTNPAVLKLPYSKIIFRIEPQIDFTNCKTTDDIFQNYVEYPVNYSIENLYLRTTSKVDPFSKEFLLQHDPMFKKVIELEKH